MSDIYSPKDHDGLTKSGEPDKRLSPEHGFGGDREAASEAGKKGAQVLHGGANATKSGTQNTRTDAEVDYSEGTIYSPKDHGGLTKSGEPDKRLSPEHGFGGDREAASEAGKKGGKT